MNIGELVLSITVDDSGVNKGIDSAVKSALKAGTFWEKQVASIKSSMKQMFTFSAGQLLADGIKKTAAAVVDFGKESISLASDLQEVQNVVDVTFGDDAARIGNWAKNAREQFGMTELQAKQYSSTMGAMFKSMGMEDGKIYEMSTAMAGLAADMASFYNLDFDTAFQKIRAGISGETEPLKQLGVNMSVANLEAFALQKGIKKTYESMTQAEQATLRYNYLLNATADAQGDFARTSDSYANSMRLLETNMDTLKANLGEALLPVVNDVVTAVNDLFDAFGKKDMATTMSDIDATFAETSKSIATNDAYAQSLISTLSSLAGKSNLTAVETAKWNSAVQELTAIYPSLSAMIGNTVGQFATSEEAIRNETAALKENALQKAVAAAAQEKYDAWAQAAVRVGEAQAKYDSHWKTWNGMVEAYTEEVMEATGATYEQARAAVESGEGIAEFTDNVVNMTEAQRELNDRLIEGYDAIWDENEATSQFKRELDAATGDMEVAATALGDMDAATQKLIEAQNHSKGEMDDNAGAGQDLKGVWEGLTEAGKVLAGSISGIASSFGGIDGEAAKAQIAINELKESMELRTAELASSVENNMDRVANGLSKPSRVKPMNANTALRNLQAQEKVMTDYQTNLEKIGQMEGVSDEFMAFLSTGSEEAMNAAAGLAKSSEEKVQQVSESYDNVQTLKDEVVQSATENLTAVDPQLQAMQDGIDSLTKSMEASVKSSAGMAVIMQTVQDAFGSVQALQTEGDTLGASTWEPTIDLTDNASSGISDVEAKLTDINGKSATVNLGVSVSGFPNFLHGLIPGFATGLDRVPFDNFPARLHRNEAVLTAAEADNWRKGARGSAEPQQPVTINLTINADGYTDSPNALAAKVMYELENVRFRT